MTPFVARDAVIAPPASALHAFLDELRAKAGCADDDIPEVTKLLTDAARMSATDIAAVLSRLGPKPFRVDPPSDAVLANQQRVADTLLAQGRSPSG